MLRPDKDGLTLQILILGWQPPFLVEKSSIAPGILLGSAVHTSYAGSPLPRIDPDQNLLQFAPELVIPLRSIPSIQENTYFSA